MAATLQPNALTTVATIQEEGGLGTESKIIRAINDASDRIERHCGRSFRLTEVPADAPEILTGSGALRLYLPRRPIVSIESILLDGAEVAEAADLDDSAGYIRTADGDAHGYIYRGDGWPCWSTSWPPPDLTEDKNTDARLRPGNIRIAYTAGYLLPGMTAEEEVEAPSLPTAVEMACIREVLASLQGPAPGLLEERTAGGWSQKWAAPAGSSTFADPRTEAALAHYCVPSRWFV